MSKNRLCFLPSAFRLKYLTVSMALMSVALFVQPSVAQDAVEEDMAMETAAESNAEPAMPMGEPVEADGQTFSVGTFDLRYLHDHPRHVPVEELRSAPIHLGVTSQGYVAPRPDVQVVETSLDALESSGHNTFYASAVRQISSDLVAAYNDRGFIGVHVAPSSDDIAENGSDVRSGRENLTFVVRAGVIQEVRTVGVGPKYDGTLGRINDPTLRRLREHSPVQPAVSADAGPGDLINRDEIDAFVHRQNRVAGRRVDVAIAPSGVDGGATLDFIVTENRPWTIYAQIANTGTESTNEWRESFGFVHNQLTNNDDVLRLNYTTTDFEDLHAFSASYKRPFADSEFVWWEIFGSYSEYSAASLDFVNEDYEGQSWDVGANAIWNVYQDNAFFVDLVAGFRWYYVEVENQTLNASGDSADADFFLPHVGLKAQRVTRTEQTYAGVDLEFNIGEIAGTPGRSELDELGRLDVDRNFEILTWNFSHSFYLEPVLNRAAWEDVTTPESSTLAHELALSVRGQYALENRLPAQFLDVAGGFYSVRGYPQSAVSGDNSVIGSVEYRFHLPRALPLEPDPSKTPFFGEPFRATPQRPYGTADWDLVLRGFVDVARVWNTNQASFEEDDFLAGAGIGVEVLYKRNISVRVDWGFALADLDNEVNAGSSQVHILATLLY